MKIRLTFKTPNVEDQLNEQIEDEDNRLEAMHQLDRYVEWGEYITVELDTDDGSMTVVPL